MRISPARHCLAVAVCGLLSAGVPVPGKAQGSLVPSRPPTDRSAVTGVYTAAQATSGQDRYALMCQSCHTPGVHASPAFVSKWDGRTLWELFDYIQVEMPMSDPGILESSETAELVAYLLKLNGLPPGLSELSTSPDALRRIRLDLVAPPSQGTP